MIDVRMNYKSKYVNNWKCTFRGTEEESYIHLFTCTEYGENIKEVTEGLNGTGPELYIRSKHRRLQKSCSVHIKGIRNTGGESYQEETMNT